MVFSIEWLLEKGMLYEMPPPSYEVNPPAMEISVSRRASGVPWRTCTGLLSAEVTSRQIVLP